MVETSNRLFRVSVKAKTGREWPKVRGIWSEGDLLVFVDFQNKNLDELPDFYILDVPSWRKLVRSIVKKTNGAKIDEENTLYWDPWEGHPNGWRGCGIKPSQISKYKDCWPELAQTQSS